MITLARNKGTDILSATMPREALESHKGAPVKVSVIVPVYNAEELVGDTLQSIQQQTLQDIEIICVNDASTDASLDVLYEHLKEDSRISIIDNPHNSGTGTTINLGLQLANGSYIQIVGNDDLLAHDALEKLYDLCESEHLDFCQYALRVFNDDPTDEALAKRREEQEEYHRVESNYPIALGTDLLQLLTSNNEYRMHNGAQIVRKSLLDQNSIRNIEGIHHEDMYYTYRILLAAQRATLIPDAFYAYRVRRGSLESTKASRTHTPEEFSAILVSAAAMIDATPEKLFASQGFATVVEREIYRYLDLATNRYVTLPPEKRREVQPEGKTANALLHIIELYASKRDQNIQNTNEKLAKLKSSRSYKLGHAMLAGPRFIKNLFKKQQKEVKAGVAQK